MRLLGPVFWYDLTRVARRQPLALWRTGYALGLLLALFLLYFTAFPGAWLGGYVANKDMSAFATRFFDVFTAIQFAAVILMTPALTANAVAEERSNNTLTFLLTTHLTNREIVLGKLATRLLQVGLLILTGLPTLALLQLMGGVYLPQVFASYAALAMTAVNLGCLGLFCGVFVRKPQQAAWRAYQILICYLALSFLSIWYWGLPDGPRNTALGKLYLAGWTAWVGMPAPPAQHEPKLFERSLDWFNVANPYYAHQRLADFQTTGDTVDQALVKVLRDYTIAHGGLALLFGGLSILRLRAVAAKQSAGITHKKRLILRPAPHPPLRDRPMLWKEMYCESKPRQRWLRLFFGLWFYFASFFPAWFFLMLTIETNFNQLASRTLFLLRYPGTLVVGLVCLRVALHAARSIGSERDRQTLDSLLTTQLRPAEIVRDKWWGSLLAGRWLLLWLVVNWCMGMIPFALHPLALPVLVVETLVYAAFAASLGMYCSVRFATTRQAVTATLLIGLIGTTFVPWGIGKMATVVFVGAQPAPVPTLPYYTRLRLPTPAPERLGLGLIPAWVLARTVVPFGEYYQPVQWYYDPSWYQYDSCQSVNEVVLPAMLGLAIYGLAAWRLRTAAERHFRRLLAGNAARWRGLPPPLATLPAADSELRPTGIGS